MPCKSKNDAQLPTTLDELEFELSLTINYHRVSQELRDVIDYILADKEYDPIKTYDGCTCVNDLEPAVSLSCFLHDYLISEGYSLWLANKIMFLVNKEIKRHNLVRSWRWLGVTLASPYFHFRNMKRRGWKWKAEKMPDVFLVYLKR